MRYTSFFIVLSYVGCLLANPPEELRQSIARIQVTSQTPSYYYPWKWMSPSNRSGQGIVVGKNLVLTLASVVIESRSINLRLDLEPNFTEMEIVHLDLDANLALLRGNLPASAKPVVLPKSSSFKSGDKISYFWKTDEGRFLEGSGVLDRVETKRLEGAHQYHLWYEAVNVSMRGGFGEPVYRNGEIMGLSVNNGGGAEMSILPVDVIHRTFLFPKGEILAPTAALGFKSTPCTQRNLRNLKGLDGMDGGCLISEVFEQGSGSKTLKVGDVILDIAKTPIDAWGRVQHPEYGLLEFPYLLSQASLDSKLEVTLMREGKKITTDLDLGLINDYNWVVPRYRNGEPAEYFIRGGFIFQSLSIPYLEAWGKDWIKKAPDDILMLLKEESFQIKSTERRDVVMLSHVLAHQVNRGYQYMGREIIEFVNGEPIRSLKHLMEVMDDLSQPKVELAFYPEGVPMVLDPQVLKLIDPEISQLYGIPKLISVRE